MDMEQIDENDAPDGYLAVAMQAGCGGCAFEDKDCLEDQLVSCTANGRKDGRGVIFVRRDYHRSFDAGMARALPQSKREEAIKAQDLADTITTEVKTPFGVQTVVTWVPGAWSGAIPNPGVMWSDMLGIKATAKRAPKGEPAKPAPAGLCVVAEQSHKLGGWGL